MRKLLVTGASGLIGGEVVAAFAEEGWKVYGIDNNMRADFFGEQGDTLWNAERLQRQFDGYELFEIDIRDRDTVLETMNRLKPDAIIHSRIAAQSHFRDVTL